MKLHSPDFQRALRSAVKAELRADPNLRKEYRRVRGFPRRSIGTRWPFRLWISLAIGGGAAGATAASHHLEPGVFVIGWVLLISTARLAQRWVDIPLQSRDMPVLRTLPVPDEVVFRWERDKLMTASLMTAMDALFGIAGMGLAARFDPGQWALAIALATASWALVLVLSAFLAAQKPGLPYSAISFGLFMLTTGSIIAGTYLKLPVFRVLQDFAPTAILLLPTAWPLALLRLSESPPAGMPLLLVAPILAVFATWKSSLRILSGRCAFYEAVIPQAPELLPGEEEPRGFDRASEPVPRSIGVTAMEQGILSGEFMQRDPWGAGWMEQVLWRWLTPREHNIAEFAFAKPPRFGANWYAIARNFLATLLLGLIAHLVVPAVQLGIVGIGLFVVMVQTMITTVGTGAAFRLTPNGGIGLPLFAAYPISIRELARYFIKSSLVQWPCVALLCVAIGVPFAVVADQSWLHGLLAGLRLGVVLFGARIGMLGFTFASIAVDSRRFHLRGMMLLVLSAFFAVGFALLAVSAVLVEFEDWAWMLCLGALGVSAAYFFLCDWLYHHLRLDLARPLR